MQAATTWQRHVRWVVPLVLAPVSYFAAMVGLTPITKGFEDGIGAGGR